MEAPSAREAPLFFESRRLNNGKVGRGSSYGKEDGHKKLPVKDKVIYSGCMGLGNLLASVVFGYYLTYFYTDVVGLPAVIAGFILLGSRCFDAFTDFAMGVTIDRVTLKSGKYRGWLKIAIIPMFVGLPLVFLNIPGVSMKLKIVWAILTYGSYGAIFNTMAYVPSSAQLVNMTQNVEERASIIGIKEVFYNIGVVLVSSLFLPMVALIWQRQREPRILLCRFGCRLCRDRYADCEYCDSEKV